MNPTIEVKMALTANVKGIDVKSLADEATKTVLRTDENYLRTLK